MNDFQNVYFKQADNGGSATFDKCLESFRKSEQSTYWAAAQTPEGEDGLQPSLRMSHSPKRIFLSEASLKMHIFF